MTKTDNPAQVGLHVFERAGLGVAPFRCIGYYESKWQAFPGAPVQAGTTCDYCGQGIMYACAIADRQGKKFKVGSNCVARTGDAGLIKAYKTHPDVRKANRAKAAAKDKTVTEEWDALMAVEANREKLGARIIPGWKEGTTRSWLEMATNAWRMCGASGRKRYLKAAKQILTEG